MADAYAAGVWTTAEVLRASAKDGHVYLELSERDADGRVLARAQAAIWSRTAERIVPGYGAASAVLLGIGSLAILFPKADAPVLLWNASPSVPIGLYRLASRAPLVGALAVIRGLLGRRPDDHAGLSDLGL